METTWRIKLQSSSTCQGGFDEESLREFHARFPEGGQLEPNVRKPGLKRLSYAGLDEKSCSLIRAHLHSLGRPWPIPFEVESPGVSVSCNITYSPEEYDRAEYLQLWAAKQIAVASYDLPPVLKRVGNNQYNLGNLQNGEFGVKENFKGQLEAVGFVGLHTTRMSGGETAQGEGLFHLSSSIALPRVLNRPHPDDLEEKSLCDGYVVENRIWLDGKSLPHFDITRTCERFGSHPATSSHLLVCSQKLRRYLDEKVRGLQWKMVVIQ